VKPKNSLSPAAAVDRAIAIADAEGLDAVTVRKVADEFGVTPMALYWHFANKEALLAAVGDAVVANLRMPDDDLGLEDYLREGMTSLIDVMREHPSATPLVAQRFMQSETGRDLTEACLERLAANGFDMEKSAAVVHYAMQIAMTLVLGEPGAEPAVKPAERTAVLAQKLALLQSLPEDRYPRLRAAAPAMIECSNSDDYYATGIDIFVAGVMADAKTLTKA
jgi:TetR/AcrR family tetracycline transcriptional repressor